MKNQPAANSKMIVLNGGCLLCCIQMHERRIEEGETNAGNVFILDLFCLKLHSHFALDFPIATDRTEPNRTRVAELWKYCGRFNAM